MQMLVCHARVEAGLARDAGALGLQQAQFGALDHASELPNTCFGFSH